MVVLVHFIDIGNIGNKAIHLFHSFSYDEMAFVNSGSINIYPRFIVHLFGANDKSNIQINWFSNCTCKANKSHYKKFRLKIKIPIYEKK